MPGQVPQFDYASRLWSGPQENFYPDLAIQHRRQVGGSCVSTGLSLLTSEEPVDIRPKLNTQDPVSWSKYLTAHGMKLAYCPTDLHRLLHYIDELIQLDDLFGIGFYSPVNVSEIGAEPDGNGFVCSSHFVIMHRDRIFDTALNQGPVEARHYHRLHAYVKRIFRVVPKDHECGL